MYLYKRKEVNKLTKNKKQAIKDLSNLQTCTKNLIEELNDDNERDIRYWYDGIGDWIKFVNEDMQVILKEMEEKKGV